MHTLSLAELDILHWLDPIVNPVLDAVLGAITFLGNGGWFFIVLALGLLCFRRTRRAGCIMAVALIIDLLVVNITLKPMVENGFHRVTDAPGLGIEALNEDVIREYGPIKDKNIWVSTDDWNGEKSLDRLWS